MKQWTFFLEIGLAIIDHEKKNSNETYFDISFFFLEWKCAFFISVSDRFRLLFLLVKWITQ